MSPRHRFAGGKGPPSRAVHQPGGADPLHRPGVPGVLGHIQKPSAVKSGPGALNEFPLPVLGELPKAHAPQAPPPGQGAFGGHGGFIVVREEGAISVEIGDLRLLVAKGPVGGMGQVVLFDLVPGHGFGAFKGLVQSVVPAGHALVYVSVQRHPQHQFLRRDALAQPGGNAAVHAGAVAGRTVCGGVERGVEVRVGVPRAVEVIGHKENVVHDVRHGLGLNVMEVASAGRSGDGQNIASPVPLSLAVQSLPELFQQQGEILLVLGPVDHARGAAGDGIFPIQVHAVQVVLCNQVQTTLGKGRPVFPGGGRVGKSGGLVPAAYGEDHPQIGIPAALGGEIPEIFAVPNRIGQNRLAVFDAGEGVVDLGKEFHCELVRRIALRGGPGGVIAHHLPGGSPAAPGGDPPGPQKGQQGENQNQQGKTARFPHFFNSFAAKCSSRKSSPHFTP